MVTLILWGIAVGCWYLLDAPVYNLVGALVFAAAGLCAIGMGRK